MSANLKDLRHKIKLKPGKIIIVIALLLIIIAVSFIFQDNIKNYYENINLQIKFKDSGKLVYIIESDKASRYYYVGDVWMSNPDGSQLTQITTSGNINSLFEWSPNNSYIVAATLDPVGNNSTKNTIVAIDVKSKEIIPVTEEYDYFSPVIRWISNDEITYRKDKNIFAFNINEKREKILGIVPPEEIIGDGENIDISQNGQWIAGSKSGLYEPKEQNLFSHNLKENKTNTLTTQGYVDFLGWINNKIYYFDYTDKNQAIWQVNPDGSGKEKIANTIDYYIARSLHASKDNNKILLYGDNSPVVNDSKEIQNVLRLFVVESKSLKQYLPPLNFFSSEAISRNGRYASFNSVGDEVGDLYLLDFTDNNYQIICKKIKDCRNAIWQN